MALERSRAALLEDPAESELLRVAARALRSEGRRATAELFARAADAPDELETMVHLGSHLLTEEAPQLACAFLERALLFAPFDAVIRSELAVAQARAGRPAAVVETLALHPCLADDPGALFEFAWASLLTGDVEAAKGARDELVQHRNAPTLVAKLDCALRRARVAPAASPPDARDYLYLEHGALLFEGAPTHAGRYAAIEIDGPRLGALLGAAAEVYRELWPRPRRVVAADEAAVPLAHALARAVGGEVHPWREGRAPSGVVVARYAADLEPLVSRLEAPSGEVVTFAVTLDWSRGLAHVPDWVGVLAREARWTAPDHVDATSPGDDVLLEYLLARRDQLPPSGRRVASAYVPDAPLPWP